MNQMPRLHKTGIEYLDYVWNFYAGCWNWKNGICPIGENCWAKRIVRRFPSHYPNGFEPTFYPEAFLSPLSLRKPAQIGVAFMGDLFGDWLDPNKQCFSNPHFQSYTLYSLKELIFYTIKMCPQHTFFFLTKCPWNLLNWSPFPQNCWVGVTVTGKFNNLATALLYLKRVECGKRYISCEPLLTSVSVDLPFYGTDKLDWLIIGAQTQPYRPPKIEWVREIVKAAKEVDIPVFLKNNLKPLLEKNHGTFLNSPYEEMAYPELLDIDL